jgi:hypothetical protein
MSFRASKTIFIILINNQAIFFNIGTRPNQVPIFKAFTTLLTFLSVKCGLIITLDVTLHEGMVEAFGRGIDFLLLFLPLDIPQVLEIFFKGFCACHGCSRLKLLHHVIMVILRRLSNVLPFQLCQAWFKPLIFFLELLTCIIFYSWKL